MTMKCAAVALLYIFGELSIKVCVHITILNLFNDDQDIHRLIAVLHWLLNFHYVSVKIVFVLSQQFHCW